jgi:hypothetical protein
VENEDPEGAGVKGIGYQLLNGLVGAGIKTFGEQLDDAIAEQNVDFVLRCAAALRPPKR